MKKILSISFLLLLFSNQVVAQGFYNHVWLLGNFFFIQDPKGRMVFDSTSYTHSVEFRKMPFLGTEATICNTQGDFLMSSNGVWIANAINDTMMNGSGLNPNGITSNWAFGLPNTYNNIFLTYPGDTNKYVLFHHTFVLVGSNYYITELYYSDIDITGDGGLGEVINKNIPIIQDTLAGGIAACKHANGRDWWVVMIKENSDSIYKILLTPFGISSITTQALGIDPATFVSNQLTFSPDGTKFACQKTDGGVIKEHFVRILDFDRCTGSFSNPRVFDVSGEIGWGLAFSPNSKYVYANSSVHVFQINIDSLTVDTVATYDGFISPPTQTCCATSFWNMYLASNGKIYVTSGSSVQHIHEMNYPDSAGLACDVQQHSIDLGSYLHLRAVPNHPNYNLGAVVGSVCDTLSVGLNEQQYNFHFGISPNPANDGFIKILYSLPQNNLGIFEVFNITGQLVYRMNLPQWSTMQFIQLPDLSNGVYTCVIKSGYERASRKLLLMK